MYATYRTWLLTFTADLRPYEISVAELRKAVTAVEASVEALLNRPLDSKMVPNQRLQYESLSNQTVAYVKAELKQF